MDKKVPRAETKSVQNCEFSKSLSMETIEATQYLKSWFRSGLFAKSDFGGAIRAEVTPQAWRFIKRRYRRTKL